MQAVANDEPADGANCNVMLVGMPSWAGLNRKERVERLEEDLDLSHITVLEKWDGSVAGAPGRSIVGDFDMERPEGVAQARVLQAYAPRDEVFYQLTCVCHRSTFDKRREVFDAIAASWFVRP